MNEYIRKIVDTLPSYMVAEWALPALINGDYTGIDSCNDVAMIAKFDEDVVKGRSIIVDDGEDGAINSVFCKDEITGNYNECVRIWLS